MDFCQSNLEVDSYVKERLYKRKDWSQVQKSIVLSSCESGLNQIQIEEGEKGEEQRRRKR